MLKKTYQNLIGLSLTVVSLVSTLSVWADGFPGGIRDAFEARFRAGPRSPVLSRRAHRAGVDSIRYWNEIAINASGIDHTPGVPGAVFGEQLGSRIYLGIHWAFDKTGGITQGQRVADYVFDNAFNPLLSMVARLK